MNEEIRIGKKDARGLPVSVLVSVVVIGGIALLAGWPVVGSYIDRINSYMAQLDQAVQRISALEQAVNALSGALPNVEAVAPLLAPPVVIPPAKALPALPALPAPPAPLKELMRSLLPAPAAVATSRKQQMLGAHNDWRRVVGVQPLKWSAELEQSAQQVANQLAANGCEMKHSRTGNGENLHISSAVKYRSGRTVHHPKTPAQIVGEWGREADLYNYGRNTCSSVCGHYTQVVWKDTTEVGCAHARCGNDDDIEVCQYYPAGNVRGQRPY